jgi:hypothetical protein
MSMKDCDNWHEEALTMQQMTGMTQPQANSVRSSLNRFISFSYFGKITKQK